MKLRLTFLMTIAYIYAFSQSKPELRFADKIRIKEATIISTKFGEQLFKGYNETPFAIVLITDSVEFLINHPNPSSDFTLLGHDDILNTTIYYRKARFAPHLLATFPAVNGLSCIVVGTPEKTNKTTTEWIITLLHEHFHQYQNTDPEYYSSVDKLNLSNGDQTGMWMLNYAFPYDSFPVKKQYKSLTKALYKTIMHLSSNKYTSYLNKYLIEKQKLKNVLTDSDYRYLSFQIWQEGLARYNEYNFLEILSDYNPSKEVRFLPDFTPFTALKQKVFNDETRHLLRNKIEESKRICFYAIGFAEGILLDKENTSWRQKYLTDKFYTEHYFNEPNAGR